METANIITVDRSAGPVAGSGERLGPQLFKWTADEGAPWYPQQAYEITQLSVQDLAAAPNAVVAVPGGFTHVATYPDQTLVAFSKPDHSQPIAQSRFGLTSLFQGRSWHEELGLYYFRARWYEARVSSFLERDPLEGISGQNWYEAFRSNSPNFLDADGTQPQRPYGPDGGFQLPEEEMPTNPFTEFLENLGRTIGLSDKEKAPEKDLRGFLEEHGIAGRFDEIQRFVRLAVERQETQDKDPVLDWMFEMMLSLRPDSTGISAEASVAWPIVGVAGGGNIQLFREGETYSVALFGFETWHHFSRKELRKKGKVETGLAPLGASGLSIGAGIPVNIAYLRKTGSRVSAPEYWTGYANAVNVGIAGVFWNEDWIGAEYPTPGFGIGAWTRPKFHMAPVGPWRNLDSSSAKALMQSLLQQAKNVFE